MNDNPAKLCGICRQLAEIHPAVNCYVCMSCAAQLIDGRWYGIADDYGTPDNALPHRHNWAYERFNRTGSAENWR